MTPFPDVALKKRDRRTAATWKKAEAAYTRQVRTSLSVAVLSLILTAPIALLGEGRVPARSVFGFRPGTGYKLATYDQSVSGSKARGLHQAHETGRSRQDERGARFRCYLTQNLSKIDRTARSRDDWPSQV